MSSVNSGKSIRNENRRTSAGIFAFIFFEIKMGRQGFEPWKAEPTDLQSAPFDRSGISPYLLSQLRDSNPRPRDYKSRALAS